MGQSASSKLFEAVKAKDIDLVKQILDSKEVEPNSLEENGGEKTALHYAAAITNNSVPAPSASDSVDKMTNPGEKTNPNANDTVGAAAVTTSTSATRNLVGYKMCKLLVEAGWNVNAVAQGGGTPLHIACANGNTDTVRYLIQKGADVFAVNSSNFAPIHSACLSPASSSSSSQQHAYTQEMIQLLLETGKKVQSLKMKMRPVQVRSEKREQQEGDDLNKEINNNNSNNSVTTRTMEQPMTKIVTSTGETALHLAAKSGNLIAVKLLLDAGADIELQIVDQQNANLDARVNGYASPLSLAIESGHAAVVKELLLVRKCKPILPAGLLGFRSLREYAKAMMQKKKAVTKTDQLLTSIPGSSESSHVDSSIDSTELIRILPDQALVVSERYKGKKARAFHALAKGTEVVVYDARQPISKVNVEEIARLAVHTRDVLFLTYSNPRPISSASSASSATSSATSSSSSSSLRRPWPLLLATAAADFSVHLWDGDTAIHEVEITGHTNTVWSIVFTKNNQTMYTAGADLTIRTWDLTSYFPDSDYDNSAEDYRDDDEQKRTNTERNVAVDLISFPSPSPSPEKHRQNDHHLHDALLLSSSSPSPTRYSGYFGGNATSSMPPQLQLSQFVSPNSGRVVKEVACSRGHEATIECLAISADSRLLVSCSNGDAKRIVLWDICSSPSGIPKKLRLLEGGHGSWVRAAVFERILTSSSSFSQDKGNGQAAEEKEGDVASSKNITSSSSSSPSRIGNNDNNDNNNNNNNCNVNPNILYTASWDRSIRKWDAPRGIQKAEPLGGHTDSILSIALSPDAKFLATASYDKTVRVWDLETWLEHGEPLVGHEGKVWCVTFCPVADSGILASCSEDETVRFWNVVNGGVGLTVRTRKTKQEEEVVNSKSAKADKDEEILQKMEREGEEFASSKQILRLGSPVNYVAFSPNGAVLACALQNDLVRLFSVGLGEVFVPLTTCRAHFTKIIFGPKGRIVEVEDICGKKKAFNLLPATKPVEE